MPAFDTNKAQRINWHSRSGQIITVGNDFSDRCYATYDPRNLAKPITKAKFDSLTSLMYTYLNPSNNLFYLLSKGSKVMHVFFHDAKTGGMTKLHEVTTKTALSYMTFLPRSCVDVWSKEVDRALRLAKDGQKVSAEYFTFRLPSKATEFQDWLYPDYPGSAEPTIKFDEYA